ncbi:MAG: hypothetical protein ACPF83_00715 [Flavobacteriales bacterium]
MKIWMTALAVLAACTGLLAADGPVKVEVKWDQDHWQFYRGGEPYYVRGVGGHVYLDEAVALGANSIRTWGIDNAKNVLDEAHSKGLTVMLGFWMGHERHGYDYSDAWAVEDQFKAFQKIVRELKDHPALLCWGVGNEMDLFYTDFNVWDAVERIAAMIKEEDPNHPSCVVTAGLDVAEVQMIQERAPSIDILGVNTYGDVENVITRMDMYGWDKPYMVTEWGPNGHWEVFKTTWGAPVEQTSSEKAASYKHRYLDCIAADKESCVGSYVFLWGQKQETTPTWYGVFLEDGSQTEALDNLHRAWKGEEPSNRAPVIESFTLNDQTAYDSVTLSPGQKVPVAALIVDPDGDELTFTWELLPESQFTKAGGDVERRPDAVQAAVSGGSDGKGMMRMPRIRGAYRLFVYAHDGKGSAATANLPFYIE